MAFLIGRGNIPMNASNRMMGKAGRLIYPFLPPITTLTRENPTFLSKLLNSSVVYSFK